MAREPSWTTLAVLFVAAVSLLAWVRHERPREPDFAGVDAQVRGLKVAGRYGDAERLVSEALVAAKRAGDRRSMRGELLALRGDLLLSLGDVAQADLVLCEAIAALEDAGGLPLAVAVHNLGAVRYQQARYADAEPLYRRALALKQQAGAGDAAIAETEDNLGADLNRLGRSAEAEPLQRDAVQRFARAGAEDDLAITLGNLGVTQLELERYAEADASLQRALEASRKVYGEAHPVVANVLVNLAECAHRRGRLADAVELQGRAVDVFAQVKQGAPADLAEARARLAALRDEQATTR